MDEVLYFGQNVRDAQNHELINHIEAAFFYLSKVFNRIWKNKLLYKLCSNLTWIADFLWDGYITVKIKDSGLPQGSVIRSIAISFLF